MIVTLTVAALGFSCADGARAATPQPAKDCPLFGWSEGLIKYLAPNAAFPTTDTQPVPTPDCNFHEWSWEAFVWATALITDPASGATMPRFMTLATPADLLNTSENAGEAKVRPLTLAARAQTFHGAPGFTEGAGAIVEADGNMLVAQNGYPVYASVHMNKSVLRHRAEKPDRERRLPEPAAKLVFQRRRRRVQGDVAAARSGATPPAGAYTTQAQVPVLQTTTSPRARYDRAGARQVRRPLPSRSSACTSSAKPSITPNFCGARSSTK